jgi:hypothetical protein
MPLESRERRPVVQPECDGRNRQETRQDFFARLEQKQFVRLFISSVTALERNWPLSMVVMLIAIVVLSTW